MERFKLIFIMLLMTASFVVSAVILDFSKKRNFYFEEGEYGVISLELMNSQTFDYQSDIKKPFVLKKVNNAGLIELIFDTRTLSGEELVEGKNYSATFVFTKKNIGKKEILTVSGIYKAELRFLVNDSLYTDFVRLNFTPDQKTFTLKINALKNSSRLQIENPNEVISIGQNNTVTMHKGLNDLDIVLAKEENFQEEVLLYRKVSEGRINELFLVLSSSGFKKNVPVVETPVETVETDSFDNLSLYSDIETPTESEAVEVIDSSGFSLLAIIIITVMALIIIMLLIILTGNRKRAMFHKYQTFFDDVATLVKVNTKGNNIDKSIEEIMMTLLDKYEYGSPHPDESREEKKKVLKKPGNPESPNINIQKSDDQAISFNIDLDFDKPEPVNNEPLKTDASDNSKPAGDGNKNTSRGFDFLDEDN
ncbi:MAG: hypothetical protein KKD38_09715 [Candidatus Delongbacteria bacterium]|nr:hypothetical protein [Candidatus Delongbacteria bacterium]MCG2760475.1 hypothetical protein [Candidatus Delongbacteria bacterium]